MAVYVMLHDDPSRAEGQPRGHFRGNGCPVLEARLARSVRVLQHRGVDVDHGLVPLPGCPGSIPWWSAVSATRASASACCCAMLGVPAGTSSACFACARWYSVSRAAASAATRVSARTFEYDSSPRARA